MIVRVFKNVPREFSGDAYRAIFLRCAAISYFWALHPLRSMVVQEMGFQELHGELHSALSLHRDSASAVARDLATSTSTATADPSPSILYGGQ